jgi:methylated-DNA-[protein]-cysteine S-methyltransferase
MNTATGEATAVRESLLTPVGTLTVIADAEGVRSVGWRVRATAGAVDRSALRQAQGADGVAQGADGVARDAIAVLDSAVDQLREYFAGERSSFELPISLAGLGESSRAVLTALRDTVPYGQTVTYGELAARSGSAVPARAIGSIMGSNPVPIVIPCHRVVAWDGLGGYSGGEPGRGRETKTWLLEHEGALPPALL